MSLLITLAIFGCFQFLILGYRGLLEYIGDASVLSIPHFRIPKGFGFPLAASQANFQFLILGYHGWWWRTSWGCVKDFQFLILGYERERER